MTVLAAPPKPRVPSLDKDGCITHLSASAVKDYLGCPLRFYFNRVLKLPQPVSPALHLGKAVHAGIQAYLLAQWRGGDMSAEAIVEAYRLSYDTMLEEEGPVTFKKETDCAKSRETGERVLRAYLESDVAKLDEKPLGVEVSLREEWAPAGVPLVGYVDLVRQGNVIVDFKTAAASPNLAIEARTHELQLTLYQFLIEQSTGEPVQGRELIFLVKTKEPKVIRLELPPADVHARFFVEQMVAAASEGIWAGKYHACPGMHCSWCPFSKQCDQRKGGVL